jgi:hypothetical protein
MNHQLHPVMEKFYLSMLTYAGLTYDEAIIKNINHDLGPITIDGKSLTLPYFDNLKNPEGRLVFHPLNENYTSPENTVFNFYKKRLVLELNLKLSYMIINLMTIASDVQMQQKIKSSKLINIISNIGETDMVLIENFAHTMRASKKINSEAFLFDIFLKKNGEINDTPYGAIGKINFIAANEIAKSLEEKDREYKVFGYKLRKKDLLALSNIFNILFPDFTDKVKYTEGTDNKVFRYMNILLKTSFMISDRLNELCDLLEELKEPTLKLVDCYSDLEWVKTLEDLYGMATEIRLIPNQLDIAIESQNHKLHIDESRAAIAEASQSVPSRTEFVPQVQQQQFQPPVQTQMQVQQPQQPQALSAEDIIKGNLTMPNSPVSMMPGMAPAMIPGMIPGMNMPQQQQFQLPSWAVQETMRANMPQGTQLPPGVVMTPQGPMMQTPTGWVPYQVPMQGNMIPMANQMPMHGGMMPMQMATMMPMTTMMPMHGGMTMDTGMGMQMGGGGITPNPMFSGR